MAAEIVCISYNDLLNGNEDLPGAIQAAFGPSGLGILLISNVPGLAEKRRRLLNQSHELASLPDKSKIEDMESSYSFGWSHGKEKLVDGRPDIYKGSFYANPVHDDPTDGNLDLAKEHPAYLRPNLWPSDLPDLEPAFKDLGRLIVKVGEHLLRQCDRYTSGQGLAPGTLIKSIARSKNHKARLLYYFPTSSSKSEEDETDCWCGWHLDHGSITGLTSAMFFDREMNEVASPDADAGLFIRDRNGSVVKATIPANCLAYQTGEALQICSGNVLQATPHCVRSCTTATVSRATFAVFIQPSFQEYLNAPTDIKSSVAVPGWSDGMSFSEFSAARFKKYYEGH